MIAKQVGIQRIIETIVVIENLRLRLGFTGDEGAVPSTTVLSSFCVVIFIGRTMNKIINQYTDNKTIADVIVTIRSPLTLSECH